MSELEPDEFRQELIQRIITVFQTHAARVVEVAKTENDSQLVTALDEAIEALRMEREHARVRYSLEQGFLLPVHVSSVPLNSSVPAVVIPLPPRIPSVAAREAKRVNPTVPAPSKRKKKKP